MANRTFVGWSPVILFGAYLSISSVLKARFPMQFCTTINAGGKELVCGLEHSTPAVRIMSMFFLVLYLIALVVAGNRALQQKLSKFGVMGLAFSVLIAFAGLWLRTHFGSEDSP